MSRAAELALKFNARGMARAKKEQWRPALAGFSLALRYYPEFEVALVNRGTCHLMRDAWDRAIEDFTAALRLNPNRALTYLNRGAAYMKQGRINPALADYQVGHQLDPRELDIRLVWYSDFQDYSLEDLLDLTQQIQDQGPDFETLCTRARLLKERGCLQAAIVDYNEVLRLDTEAAWIYHERGEAYHCLEDWDRALADYNRAMQTLHTDWIFRLRGLVAMQLGDFSLAIHDFTAAIQLAPNRQLYYIDRASAYEAAGNHEQAAQDKLRAAQLPPR